MGTLSSFNFFPIYSAFAGLPTFGTDADGFPVLAVLSQVVHLVGEGFTVQADITLALEVRLPPTLLPLHLGTHWTAVTDALRDTPLTPQIFRPFRRTVYLITRGTLQIQRGADRFYVLSFTQRRLGKQDAIKY